MPVQPHRRTGTAWTSSSVRPCPTPTARQTSPSSSPSTASAEQPRSSPLTASMRATRNWAGPRLPTSTWTRSRKFSRVPARCPPRSARAPRASRTSSPSPARRRCMGLSSNSSATPGSMPAISSTGAPRRARAASRPSRATSLDSRMAARLSSRASIAAANALSISASTRVSGKCSAPRRSSPSPQPPNARGWTRRLSPVTRSSSRSALRSRRCWRVILCRTTRKGPTVRGRSLLPPRWRPSATSSRSGLITVFRRRANFSRALTSTTSPAPPPTPARPPLTPASASGSSTASGISV